jgi:hypothetical protein
MIRLIFGTGRENMEIKYFDALMEAIENVMGILMMQMVIWQLMRKRRKMSD